MLRRDRGRRDALRQLLHPRYLQLGQLRCVRHHDPRLLVQAAQRQVMLIQLVNIIVVDRGRILVRRQMIVVVVGLMVVTGLMTGVEVQSRHRHADARVRRPHALQRTQQRLCNEFDFLLYILMNNARCTHRLEMRPYA